MVQLSELLGVATSFISLGYCIGLLTERHPRHHKLTPKALHGTTVVGLLGWGGSIYIYIYIHIYWFTVDSQKLEHGCRLIYAGAPSFFGLRLWGPSCL